MTNNSLSRNRAELVLKEKLEKSGQEPGLIRLSLFIAEYGGCPFLERQLRTEDI
jgi:hypothetical protein